MKNEMLGLKIVTLDSPYEMWDDPRVQTLFSRIINLKRTSYKALYPYECLPVDQSDFIGTHHVICKEVNNDLYPVMVAKTVLESRCQKYDVEFPGFSLLKGVENSVNHYSAMDNLIKTCKAKKEDITYSGGWAMDPEFRDDKKFKMQLFNLYSTMHTLYHKEKGIYNIIGAGNLRFKTDVFFKQWGGILVQHEGKDLPILKLPHYKQEEIVLICLGGKFTKEIEQLAESFRSMWEDRIVFSEEKEIEKIAA